MEPERHPYPPVVTEAGGEQPIPARELRHRDHDRPRGPIEGAHRVRQQIEMAMRVDVGHEVGSCDRSRALVEEARSHAMISARPRSNTPPKAETSSPTTGPFRKTSIGRAVRLRERTRAR